MKYFFNPFTTEAVSMDWFLYDNGFRHERVNQLTLHLVNKKTKPHSTVGKYHYFKTFLWRDGTYQINFYEPNQNILCH